VSGHAEDIYVYKQKLERVAAAARRVDDELQRNYPTSQYAVDEALAEMHDALKELEER
jgi:hypothetical protein